MMRGISTLRSCATLCLMVALLAWNGPAGAAKASECTKIGVCFCVNQDLKITIDGKVANFRQLIVEQHKKGKAVGYLSVPLSPAGGGYMKVNMEVAENAKAAVEKRFGADFAWILNPGTVDANLPVIVDSSGRHTAVGEFQRHVLVEQCSIFVDDLDLYPIDWSYPGARV